MKRCEVCNKDVPVLWKSKRTNKQTGEVIQPACCKRCMPKQAIKSSTKPSNESKVLKSDLNVFFASQALVFPDHCENCGERLDKSSLFAKRSQTCHILPKSNNSGFPSVATHPQNKVFMCCHHGCHGHGDWDNLNADKRKTMPVYEKAIERFRSFENDLSEKQKIKAYKYLGLD